MTSENHATAFAWTERPSKLTTKPNSSLTSKPSLIDDMAIGETRGVKIIVRGLYTADKNGRPYTTSKGAPYLKACLLAENLDKNKESIFYEPIYDFKMRSFLACLGLTPDNPDGTNGIHDVNVIAKSDYNSGAAVVVKNTYKNRQTNEDMPCLQVKEWVSAKELKPFSSVFNNCCKVVNINAVQGDEIPF